MQRELGTTGLPVSRIGLGLAALGRPGYINLGHAADLEHTVEAQDQHSVEAMRAHTHAVLDQAWALGVRYFDAARSYGRAEDFLGSWLRARDIAPDAVTIGSKWGYTYTAGWQVEAEQHEVKEHSRAVLRRQWAETRANLGPYLDLYQIHSATFASGVLENAEVLAELARFKRDGTAIGLTLSGPDQPDVLRRALAVEVDGVRVFDTVQATWNLLEPSVGEVLGEAHAAGLGVLVKEALANGRLTPRNDHPAFAELFARLAAQAARLHTTIDALALAAVLAQPWADVVLSGAAIPAHLDSNLRARDVAWDDESANALAPLAEPPVQYWQTRSNLEWN
ncbi:MAG: aldo/keto reductase [Chloroflexi bacterium]|nr:aldo/keto reductase [Chloroflexota bacterium]